MAILADTNILLSIQNAEHPHYQVTLAALHALQVRGEELCTAPQNLIEFWAVSTRRLHENGLGMKVDRAAKELASLTDLFITLPSTPEIFLEWRRLVTTLGISGKQCHDAHLIAAMRVHNVGSILTWNIQDFRRFPGITVLDPSTLIRA